MWSEHCSYKSSRIHLKKLPTRGKRVVQGPGENAGAVDIGDGYAAVFKIESHNHPSFIEPYQGAATGVGGIIRDIFTMGARPIALLNSLRFGPLDGPDGARTRRIVEGVVAGIAGYGNSIGIPTIGGEIAFEPPYAGQPAGQRAVPRHRQGPTRWSRARPAASGNPVYYVGVQHRPRRDPWRDDGLGGVRRELVGEAAGGAGRRSVHGEAAARSVPGADADRRADRRSGHGRRRPDLLDLRDGRARRRRRRDRRQPRAAARDRHEPLRDHAVRIAGADAAGRQARPRGRSRGDLREVGPARRQHRRRHRRWADAGEGERDGRRRDSEHRAGGRGADLRPPDRASGVSRRRADARSSQLSTTTSAADAFTALLAVADDRQQALGLPPVRSHGPHQLAGARRAWARASSG